MTRCATRILLPLMIITLMASAAAALDLGGHDRDGVVIGLTLGHGWNSIQLTDGNGDFRDTGDVSAFTGAFKVGWARNDHLVGFVGVSGWKRSFNQQITPSSVTNLNFLAELYFFPTGQGFWAKGGVGTGSLDYYVNTADPLNRIDFREGGFTYTVGAGYEFRAGQTAIGIAYDYTKVDMGDFDAITGASVDNHVLAMSLHWYQD